MADPLITWLQSSQKAQLEVHLPRTMGGLMQRREKLAMGLSAVMEDCSGALSHWSLHHPSSLPDFHHREGFIAVLERSGPGSIE